MLSRRIFQELTEGFLYGPRITPLCFCATWHRINARDSALSAIKSIQSRASSSSTRWKTRQFRDRFAREAKVQGLKSRAAFKLVEMNEKYKIFKPSATVIDLGYAPGSWSQVAVTMTQPNGRVIGIDILPAQPPKGVSTIQGNFLSPEVQAEVRAYVRDPDRGRPRKKAMFATREEAEAAALAEENSLDTSSDEDTTWIANRSYVEFERHAELDVSRDRQQYSKDDAAASEESQVQKKQISKKVQDELEGRVVDVVLSDMSEPWPQTSGFWKMSISDPYRRMMNTSGIPFRDHAGSMDLCSTALEFCFDTLRTGGSFVCKFYQGAEDKALETRLRRLFEKVHREKPESSRSESKEAYFVALRRKSGVTRTDVLDD